MHDEGMNHFKSGSYVPPGARVIHISIELTILSDPEPGGFDNPGGEPGEN